MLVDTPNWAHEVEPAGEDRGPVDVHHLFPLELLAVVLALPLPLLLSHSLPHLLPRRTADFLNQLLLFRLHFGRDGVCLQKHIFLLKALLTILSTKSCL